MSKLELKVPPVVVLIAVAFLMGLASQLVPNPGIAWPRREAVAAALATLGAGVAVFGVVAFRRAGTTVNPLQPEKMSALVVGGIYRFTRNPMYLGMLLTLAGWAVHLGNAAPWLVWPLYIAYLNRFQIGPEERALAARFGDDFEKYRARVRRWL